MKKSVEFFKSVINSVTQHLVIVDQGGSIQYVNEAWINFGNSNACLISNEWQGINYLDVCDASALDGESHAGTVAAGIRKVLDKKTNEFYYEYPCHSPTEKRWFMMRVTPLKWNKEDCYVISHQNITERKLIEDKVHLLSREDGLTGLANRRRFDEFLLKEWRRAARLKLPLSLILLDVDHFKLFNDHYGHQAGDRCLQSIAKSLAAVGKRPGDLSARYGGEEFALILGNTGEEPAIQIAHQVRKAVQDLHIEHKAAPGQSAVTASLGVATLVPHQGLSEHRLIELADQALYAAKHSGRNRVSVSEPEIEVAYLYSGGGR